MSPPETPLSAACLSWRRRRRAGWAAASQGRSPSAHPGTCGHEGGEVAGRGTAAPRGPSGAGGSPACVHRGEREGHALEQQDHEESLAGRAVSHALAVLAGLGAGSWGIRAASGPETRPPGAKRPEQRQGSGSARGRCGPSTWCLGGAQSCGKLGGWARAQGWDPGSGAWPLAPCLRPWARGRGGPRELFSE